MVVRRLAARYRRVGSAMTRLFWALMSAVLFGTLAVAFLVCILAIAWSMWGVIFIGYAIWELAHDN